MGFSRQESWSGLPCPPPGDLSDLGAEPGQNLFCLLALAEGFLTASATWEEVHGPMIFIYSENP